jgi:hypothetical protein
MTPCGHRAVGEGASRRQGRDEVTHAISRFGWFVVGRLYGLRNRGGDLRTGMGHTLQRIRETAERDTPEPIASRLKSQVPS